jgi:beta-glucanase (GH16 family)
MFASQTDSLLLKHLQQADSGFNYTSARIVTTPSLNFTYGKLDIVAKLPAGVGTWPAFWLLPSGDRYAIWTPTTELDPNNYLKDGEIDIMEATGSIPGQVTSSAQSYDYYPGHNERMGTDQINNDATTFHDYELQWTPTSLEFLVDGVVYHTVTKAPTDNSDVWPYNQPYYLILNIAMGGTEGGTEVQQYPPNGIDNSSGPWQMDIKSIDYYSYTGK